MSYTIIDPILSAWVEENALTLYTRYKDAEVRSVELVSPTGRRFQIWIDSPIGNSISVHVWDFKKLRRDWSGRVDKLRDILDEALRTVKFWMAD